MSNLSHHCHPCQFFLKSFRFPSTKTAMKRFLLWKMRFSATSIVPYLLYMTGYAWKLERVSPLSSSPRIFDSLGGFLTEAPFFMVFCAAEGSEAPLPPPAHREKLRPSPSLFFRVPLHAPALCAMHRAMKPGRAHSPFRDTQPRSKSDKRQEMSHFGEKSSFPPNFW